MPRAGVKTRGTFTKANHGPGRPKGSKNFCTAKLREMITALLTDDPELVAKDLKRLRKTSLYKYFRIRNDMLSYVLPRLQAVALQGIDAGGTALKPPVIVMGPAFSAEQMLAAERAVETSSGRTSTGISFAAGGPGMGDAATTDTTDTTDGDDVFTDADNAATASAPPPPQQQQQLSAPSQPTAAPQPQLTVVREQQGAPSRQQLTSELLPVWRGLNSPTGGVDTAAMAAADRERKQSLRAAMQSRIEEDNARERAALAERARRQALEEEQ